MARPLFTNNASAKLNAAIEATDTTLELETGSGALFPETVLDDYFFVTLSDVMSRTEIVKVTARDSDTLTIVRAQEDTDARAFSKGDAVELRITAEGIKELMNTWWIRESADVAFVDATSFTVSGDKTADYEQYRAVQLWQTDGGTGYITGSTYDLDTGLTTVVVNDCAVDSGLIAVELGGTVSASPKYYGKAADSDKLGGYEDDIIPGIAVPFTGTIDDDGHPVNRKTGSADPRYGLCDGSTYTAPDGVSVTTPNLGDKFVLAAGLSHTAGASGGSETHGHTASSASAGSHSHGVTINGHTLTWGEMPSHSHSFSGTTNTTGNHRHGISMCDNESHSGEVTCGSDHIGTYYTAYAGDHAHTISGTTGSAGSNSSHSHSGSSASAGSHSHGVTVENGSTMPPFYTLAYIMKL